MMSLKSVSVSTRIVALGVVMLMPAWGWAEMPTVIEPLPKGAQFCDSHQCYGALIETGKTLTVEDFSHGPIATCDLDYKHCHILEPESFPCYQRMREAMKAMDKLMKIELGTLATKSMQEQIGRPTWEQWGQTMKDCVEGRQ